MSSATTPTPDDILVERLIDWLRQAAARTDYGSVGISVVFHGGKVQRVIRTEETSAKPGAGA